MFDLLKCPICNECLNSYDNCLKCKNNHSYDMSKTKYVNLLNPGKKNNFKAGDSKEMIDARTLFFKSGAYQRVSDMLSQTIKQFTPKTIVDAGCGEGYYTNNIAQNNTYAEVLGFDMSKFGIEHASKVAKQMNLKNVSYCVGNIFNLPLFDETIDMITNVFAPVASQEFYRVLKPKSYLLIASAGEQHLNGLKTILYSNVYENDSFSHKYDGFELLRKEKLKYETEIAGNDTIINLFKMTPYYHRTSLEDKAKLDSVNSLTTTIDVDFFVLRKK